MARYLRTMVAALAATTTVAGEASAQWTAPVGVSVAGTAEGPKVAIDHAGTATVVWTTTDETVHARRIDAAGVLGPIVDMGEGRDAAVAVDPAGNAIVAWTGEEGGDTVAQARRITAAGALGDVRTLSAPGELGFGPLAGVDAAGAALLVWTRFVKPGYRLQARRIDAAGALGPIEDVTPDSPSNIDYELAVDPAGNAVVVWRLHGAVQWRRLGGPVEDLAPEAHDPDVAISSSGVATAVWTRFDGVVQAQRSAGVVDLSAAGAGEPDVVVDADGHATVVWTRDGRVERRRYAADGSLGEVADVAPGGRPRVSLATAIWLHDGAVGALGSPDLTAPGVEAESPELATDPFGRSIAVWAAGGLVETARFPVPVAQAPVAAAVVAPVTACPAVEKPRSRRARAKRRRVKGVSVALAAGSRLVSARLLHKGRSARLTGPPRRLRVPRRLVVGTRVTLALRLRSACGEGTFRLRTRVGWITPR